VPPAVPSPLPVQVPLFNPREIQLGKEDALSAEGKFEQGENPFRKAADGRDN